ncbi:N(4)-(Beta-N-acetylglucosaminyl)-L-asparaginase-like [Saccoglossus kowalevskii]
MNQSFLTLQQFVQFKTDDEHVNAVIKISRSVSEIDNVYHHTAYETIQDGGSAVDSVEVGCNFCEDYPSGCRYSVGYEGTVDEDGEATLDAMIMDGITHDAGGVGGLRRVKRAISVARDVMDHTKHSLLVGDQATDFARDFGEFAEEDFDSDVNEQLHEEWEEADCQPNFWENVTPDPTTQCGPYSPIEESVSSKTVTGPDNHDTIGMVVIDVDSNVAVGTSTNGLDHKIPGRVGDSPIIGSGAYADNEVGGAAATGDGDIMMRFLPSYQAVENMRHGMTPSEACDEALSRIAYRYEDFSGAVIAANLLGEYGAACYGYKQVEITVMNPSMEKEEFIDIVCDVVGKQPATRDCEASNAGITLPNVLCIVTFIVTALIFKII